MSMRERDVEITARADGTKCRAKLLICPDCDGETFVVYFPEGIDHCHFQCTACGTSFCDGCAGVDSDLAILPDETVSDAIHAPGGVTDIGGADNRGG